MLLLALMSVLPPCVASEPGFHLFDAHMHYNAEFAGTYTPQDVAGKLKAAGVRRALVTGLPAGQAQLLYAAAPDVIVPLLGVYENADDKQLWMHDMHLPDRVALELNNGPWRGIGELHLFAAHRYSPVFLRLLDIAVAHDLPLLMHCDPAVIDSLFEHAPAAAVIWAHAGAYPYPPLLRDYIERYPRLYIDLSMRDERIAPRGEIDPEWEQLFWEYPDRFMVGVDTFSAERWRVYDEIVVGLRQWLAQLPTEVAQSIARKNAEALFAGEGRQGGVLRQAAPDAR